jgi:hypothetical protein
MPSDLAAAAPTEAKPEPTKSEPAKAEPPKVMVTPPVEPPATAVTETLSADPKPSHDPLAGGLAKSESPLSPAPGTSPAPVPLRPTATPSGSEPKPPAEVVVRKASSPEAGSIPKPLSTKPEPASTEQGSLFGMLTTPTGLAIVGGALVALIALVVMRRRRDAEDDDPLYSVMSADDAGASDDYESESASARRWGYETSEPEAEVAAAEPRGFDVSDEPVGTEGTQQLGLGRTRESIFDEPAAATPEPLAAPASAPAYSAPSFSVPSEASGADLSRLAGDLVNRVADLEKRLEQLLEARERIERQVAAQTEELRVQRAAIARTQRVVRSMTKGEDVATEPVPRNF